MGGQVSTTADAAENVVKQAGKANTELEIIKLLMPLFYIKDTLSPVEYEEALRVWKIVTKNQSKHFNEIKAVTPSLQGKIVGEYMHLVFYDRLFTVHPGCRGMFSRSLNKMNLLPMVTVFLDKLHDNEALRKSLVNLVAVHNRLGVRAVEYGIVGEVIMFALKEAVGPLEYTAEAHSGWCKIYSRLLDVIVPEVVFYELEHPESAEALLDKRMSKMGCTGSAASLVGSVYLPTQTSHANTSLRSLATGAVSVHRLPS